MKRYALPISLVAIAIAVNAIVACAALKPAVKAADSAADLCVARAVALGDHELETVCRAGGSIVDVIDLFAARSAVRDGGAE